MQNIGLMEKIQNLPPETADEVEDFVDFLTAKNSSANQTASAAENNTLADRAISRTEAAEQRRSLASFAADWELPEMEIYDKL